MRMCFDNIAGVTLAPFKLITNLKEAQNYLRAKYKELLLQEH